MKVNLLPQRYRESTFSFKRVFTVLFIAIILMGGAALFFMGSHQLDILRQEVQILEGEHQALERNIARVRELEGEIDDVYDYLLSFKELDQRLSWADLMIELGYMDKEDIQLTSFRVSNREDVTINGKVKDYELVTVFMDELDASPFLYDAELITTGLTRRDEMVEFRIECRLSEEDLRL